MQKHSHSYGSSGISQDALVKSGDKPAAVHFVLFISRAKLVQFAGLANEGRENHPFRLPVATGCVKTTFKIVLMRYFRKCHIYRLNWPLKFSFISDSQVNHEKQTA
jgi:hypothetical protein